MPNRRSILTLASHTDGRPAGARVFVRPAAGNSGEVGKLLTRLEQASGLDPLSNRLQSLVQRTLRSRRIRDVLHGVWLGHPLHPAMVQVPIGAWMSGAILDLLPGRERSAGTLMTIGTASALPTAIAGAADWSELAPDQRRIGLLHALGNGVAMTMFTGSIAARVTGRYQLGRALSFAGLGIAAASAYLGGHLAYQQGAQVNQAAPQLHLISGGWHDVASLDDLPHHMPAVRSIDGVPVLLYRDGGDVTAFLGRCAHQNGPLSDGQVEEVDGEVCVVCPWHGSTFSLSTGQVVHGPAASDQPVLRTRVAANGAIQVSAP